MAGSDGFTVDPARMRTGATKFDTAADMLEDACARLESGLAAQGECWGGDESGQEFAKDYVPGQQQAVEAFRSLAQALRNVRSNVDANATAHESTDQAGAASFRNQGV